MNSVTAAAAAVAALLVFLAGAPAPAETIVGVAAGAAFLAILLQGPRARTADWFTVRVLLSGNLVVFGIANFRRLGGLLAALAIVSGAVLVALALISYAREFRGRGPAQ